jgi:hypothetical protein
MIHGTSPAMPPQFARINRFLKMNGPGETPRPVPFEKMIFLFWSF